MADIDHFMYACADFDLLVNSFRELTGIDPSPGGSHPDLGTRNKLIGTASSTYLELIAPDPGLARQSPLRQVLSSLAKPQLHRVIALGKSDDFPAIIQAYAVAGIQAEVRALSRINDAGDTLRWQLLMPEADNPYGIFAPLFIDWQDTAHPSTRLPAAPCTILGYEAGHPRPADIRALWDALGFDLPLIQADSAYMKVHLDTPKGKVALTT